MNAAIISDKNVSRHLLPRRSLICLSVFIFAAGGASNVDARSLDLDYISTRKDSPHFYDVHGRVRIFHGGNRVEKQFPWYFVDMVESDDEMDRMADMGLNVVRLGWMWSGFNGAGPGQFNMTYAEQVGKIVQRLAKRGIYTLLDMHQDVLSSKFCLYDGAPLWVVNKSVSAHPFPWPLKGDCSSRSWGTNELSEAAGSAYQDLYDNRGGMLDDWIDFWEKSASVWKNASSIIGYELINEPFAGNWFKDPLLLLPGVAGEKNLMRSYDAAAAGIRKHDNRRIIFYEPVTWGMIFDGKITGSGLDHSPGGDAYANRSAFSYHYYCATFVPGQDHEPKMRRVVCDDVTGPLVFEAVKKHQRRTGGASFMTEFGACSDRAIDECAATLSLADKHLQSWTDYGNSQGAKWTPDANWTETFSRTYARAIAGYPLNMTYDPISKDFSFCFTLDTTIQMPTEIYYNPTMYVASGIAVQTTANLKHAFAIGISGNNDTLLITPVAASSGLTATSDIGCVEMKRR